MTRAEYYHQDDAPTATSIAVSVTAFVRDPMGPILFIRRSDDGLYALPGGRQQVGETVSHAVAREVKEENGINVEVTDLIGVYSDPDCVIAYGDGVTAQEFTLCFRASAYGGAMRVSAESSEAHWVVPEDVDSLDMSPATRLRVQHGLAGLPRPHYT